MSEGPFFFDVWVMIKESEKSAATDALLKAGQYESKLRARLAINRSLKEQSPVLLAVDLTWGEALTLRSSQPAWSAATIIVAAGLEPNGLLKQCDVHAVLGASCFPCPVCANQLA